MTEADSNGDRPVLLPWATPRLETLDIGGTLAGAAPNIQETVLTDASLAPS